jgi:hypothetical protein
MEKIKKQAYIRIPPLILDYNDIVELVDLLKDVSKDIKIIADEYRIDCIEELKNISKQKIKKFEITIYDPYINIEMSRSLIMLWGYKEEPLSWGTIVKVSEYLKGKQRKNWTIQKYFSSIMFGGLIINTIKQTKLLFESARLTLVIFISVFLFAISLFLFIRMIYIDGFNYTIIYLSENKKEKSFLFRKKDEIVLVLFSAVIGGLITYILTIIQ